MTREEDAPLVAAIERLEATGDETSTLGELLDGLGSASLGFSLFLPAVIVASPLSGIPGLSSLCGIAIALTAAQMIAQRTHIWLPRFIRCREVTPERRERVLGWLRRPSAWLDHLTRPRLEWLLKPPFVVPLQLACLVGGAAMPFLELVPFTSSIIGISVAFFSVAMITRDGLLALAGLAVVGAAVAAVTAFAAG